MQSGKQPKWGYMSDGMPHGIQQQQQTMHRHAL